MATVQLKQVYLQSCYCVGNRMEQEGPLGKEIDQCFYDYYLGEKSFEKAEIKMVKTAIEGALKIGGFQEKDIQMAFGGDLLNQITASNYVMREYNIPFIGVYGACSTFALSFALSAVYVENHIIENGLNFTSSHNLTAERQYRYPVEYGNQKVPSSNHTVTGAGAVILGRVAKKIKISSVTFGTVIDFKVKDPNDMGAAMAPAAWHTIQEHIKQCKESILDYDYIYTGDLSKVGSDILKDLAKIDGIDFTNHRDCGLMIYDREIQPVYSGGSGCACSALVTISHIIKELEKGTIKKVLVVATGALLSPTIVAQKESIPSIAHAFCLEVNKDDLCE